MGVGLVASKLNAVVPKFPETESRGSPPVRNSLMFTVLPAFAVMVPVAVPLAVNGDCPAVNASTPFGGSV